MKIYQELLNLLDDEYFRNNMLIFKGNDELSQLTQWLDHEKLNIKDEIFDKSIYLKNLIDKCVKCKESSEKKFGYGSGANNVMIILNAPKLINKLEKDLFKNDSIDLLKKIIKSINLNFSECYITNLTKCDHNDFILKPSQLMQNCEQLIEEEISVMQPRIIIVMGDIVPLQKVLKKSVDVLWYNVDHPITLLKTPELKKNTWNTLKLVMENLK